MKKEYSNEKITVVWEPQRCIHSEICAHGLPKVFDPNRRPWISLEEAENDAIVAQVKQCPSGALSIKETQAKSDGPKIKIQLIKGGPLILRGACELTDEEGNRGNHENLAFCRCRRSQKFPYCDGSHKT